MILAIDQGTTSSRAIVFDANLTPLSSAQKEFKQHYPASGHVEHDALEIWKTVLSTVKKAIKNHKIKAIGITNQRETIVLWDKKTGVPLHHAIVWQDRRTAAFCAALKPHEAMIKAKTGLTLDPYFSASKLKWLLDNMPDARIRANNGELAAGTIDSFLLWKLTNGRSFKTDATNASRTMLYNIHEGVWDNELLNLFNIPRSLLPDIHDCAANFGATTLFGGEIPVLGMAGDQQAALIGQGCFELGMVKSTYGTGCFALMNTGEVPQYRDNLLTTVAYQLNGKRVYALEGSVYIAGAAVQWLRDGLKLIKHARESDALALKADENSQVILVPAFTGLGAPYWNSDVRGALFGLTRNTGRAEIMKATLQSVGFQTRDLMDLMGETKVLRVDGGMCASDYTMQFLADVLNTTIERPHVLETTAKGAAYLAGLALGIKPAAFICEKRFTPQTNANALYNAWRNVVAKLLNK
jgi:glycerol kinase